jgi:hypothetical protein
MRDRHGTALATAAARWPADDTEESVVGTNLHQTAITNLRWGINEAAALATPEGAPLLWQAGGQTMVEGFRHPDGSPYTTLPDVFVYPRPWDDLRGSLSVDADGPPVLIVEVLSPTTHENDLDLVEGKGYSYARAGIREYLIVDPAGAYLPDQGQGWRLEGGAYRPWRREPDGRWHSRVIPVAIGLEGVRAAVWTADGRRLLREGEVERRLDREVRERRRAEAVAAEERRRAEALAQLERAHAEELARLRRRLDELERGR